MDEALPAGCNLRSARPDDAGVIAALINSVDLSLGSTPWVTEDDVAEDFEDPHFGLETDTWVLEDGDEVVGYAELWNARRDDAEALEAQGWVSPAHRDRGIGTFLVDRFEEAATAAAPILQRRPVLLRTYFPGRDERARAIFEARGYSLVRHFWHMAIELKDLPQPRTIPASIALRTLDPDRDVRALHELMEHAFAEHWGWSPTSFENFWRRVAGRADFDPGLTLLAVEDGRLVGAAINVVKLGEGWVNDLGVRKEARGRGLGELLLTHSFALFERRGLPAAALGVDAGNRTGAVRLYERVGMRPRTTFDSYEKELLGVSG